MESSKHKEKVKDKEKDKEKEKDNKQTLFVNSPEQINLNNNQIKKMAFIMNALAKGWSIKKREDEYFFTKKHEGKREVFRENYLEGFVQSNFDMAILQHL